MCRLSICSRCGWLEAEVEVGQGLHGRQAREAHGGHEGPIMAQGDLRAQQRLRGLEVAAVGAGQDSVEPDRAAAAASSGTARALVRPAQRVAYHMS